MSLYDPRSRRLLNRVTRAIDWTTRNRTGIESLVQELMTIDLVAALGGAADAEVDQAPIYKKWWFWTAVAAGVAGVTPAVALAASPEGPPPKPTEGTIVLTF